MLALAAAKTKRDQAEVAEKDRLRQIREKEEAVAEAKRLAADKVASEARRREREKRERERREEEERKERELPKTRNLYALRQERIKRGMDPDGKDDVRAATKVSPCAWCSRGGGS